MNLTCEKIHYEEHLPKNIYELGLVNKLAKQFFRLHFGAQILQRLSLVKSDKVEGMVNTF